MQPQNLNLAIGPFGKGKDGFIHRAAGDRELLLDTAEQFKGHIKENLLSPIRMIMLTRWSIQSIDTPPHYPDM